MKETMFFTADDLAAEQATLHILDQSGRVRSCSIEEIARVGRDTAESTAEIRLTSKITSRKHGEFTRLPTGYFYRDVGSLNGTYINGKRMPTGQVLSLPSGSVIMLANQDTTIQVTF